MELIGRLLIQVMLALAILVGAASAASGESREATDARSASVAGREGGPRTNSAGDKGALCDGQADDTAALTLWAAAVTTGSFNTLPPGVCRFTSPIAFPLADHVAVRGGGTTLLFAGRSTTETMLTIGRSVNGTSIAGDGCAVRDWTIEDVSIKSATRMTAGDALRISDLCAGELRNVSLGRTLNGDGKLWNGLHLDGGNTVHVRGAGASARNDALLVNGDALLQFTDPVIEGTFLGSNVGVHIAGNVGGFTLTVADILLNHVNVQIDQAETPRANSQIFFGPNVAIDVTNGGFNRGVYVVDPGGSNSFLFLNGTWVASALDTCIYFESNTTWTVTMAGGAVYNCRSAGIYTPSSTVRLNVTGTFMGRNGNYAINNPAGAVSKCGVAFADNKPGDTFGTITSSC